MRKIAIINDNNGNIQENIIKMFPNDMEITVFTTEDNKNDYPSNVKSVIIPENIRDYGSKVKNFVTAHYFAENYKGFLHVIEDGVMIYNEATVFLDNIEEMMLKLNLKHWFNTITDPCNYTFKKYNPRLSVTLDAEDIKDKYNKKIYFTSHANTSWICYNYDIATFDDVKFDESFSIAMYYIIKFLAEKRNHKKAGEIYYMNFYPTIDEEKHVFKLVEKTEIKVKTQKEAEKEQKTMQKEGEIYQNMQINNSADMSIEQIMDDVYAMIKNN